MEKLKPNPAPTALTATNPPPRTTTIVVIAYEMLASVDIGAVHALKGVITFVIPTAAKVTDGPVQPVPDPPTLETFVVTAATIGPMPCVVKFVFAVAVKVASVAVLGTNAQDSPHLIGVNTQSTGFHENAPPDQQSPFVRGTPVGEGVVPVEPPGTVPVPVPVPGPGAVPVEVPVPGATSGIPAGAGESYVQGSPSVLSFVSRVPFGS
jgi:hypothetical protein